MGIGAIRFRPYHPLCYVKLTPNGSGERQTVFVFWLLWVDRWTVFTNESFKRWRRLPVRLDWNSGFKRQVICGWIARTS